MYLMKIRGDNLRYRKGHGQTREQTQFFFIVALQV